MDSPRLSTQQKALQLNLDESKYGTVAEIGAGQEVASWFFRAGRAAGTIAKAISAYDMAVSDAVYGPTHRYVSRERLCAMLRHEYDLLLERLAERRGEKTCFFAFASTVATRGPSRDAGEGWMGVRFQHEPRADSSDILVHVGLLDKARLHEQEALGVLGVNLIHAAYHRRDDPNALIGSLLDDLSRDRVEVDLIRFWGPAFSDVDNRLTSLQLVEQGLTDATMFTAEGEVVQPSEVLYKKPVLVARGRFCPLTHLSLDVLERARALFLAEADVRGEEPVVLLEMTLADLEGAGAVAHPDFLSRVDALRAVGKTVLVSKFGRYFRLIEYLSRYTQKRIGIALGLPNLRKVLDGRFYEDLPGGALEAAGRTFRRNVRVYVHPTWDAATGRVMTADNFEVNSETRHLYDLLLQDRCIVAVRDYDPDHLHIQTDGVLAQIQSGDPAWEAAVPAAVVEAIKRNGLFGWGGAPQR